MPQREEKGQYFVKNKQKREKVQKNIEMSMTMW